MIDTAGSGTVEGLGPRGDNEGPEAASFPEHRCAEPSEGRRVLIVGINYAPEETGIAPYTTDLAEHLAASGWGVTVVTGMPHYPQWRVATEYRGSLRVREHRKAVDLRRVRHYTPSRQSALGRALYEGTFFVQAVSQATPVRPDCVVGVVPSLGGGAAAALWARRYKVPLGLILQDLVGRAAAQSGLPGGSLAARPAHAVESWVVRQAHGVVIAAETFRSRLELAGVDPVRIRHVPNWTHVESARRAVSDVRRSMGWPQNVQLVLHAGNMGYKQGLDNVLAAARLAASDSPEIRFVLMGDGNERRRLQLAAVDLPNVQFIPPQPEEVFMDLLAAADVLLVNERNTVVNMSLPSKITSYLRSGRPIVGAVPLDGATAKELTATGGAMVVPAADPVALITGLRALGDDPVLRQRLVASGERYASDNLDRTRSLQRMEHFVRDVSLSGSPIR